MPSLSLILLLASFCFPQESQAVQVCPEDVEAGRTAGTDDMIYGEDCVRWTVSSGGLLWIPDSVAIGDHGASVFAGKHYNNMAMTLYPGGAGIPVFDLPLPDYRYMYVDVAEEDSLAVALLVRDLDPGSGNDFEATVCAYRDFEDGTPEWSFTFPTGTYHLVDGRIAVSRDGSVILAVWPYDLLNVNLVAAFDSEGNPISYGSIPNYFSFWPGVNGLCLSDDGSRALVQSTPDLFVYDVGKGEVEFETEFTTINEDTITMSGDGNRIAFGYWDFVRGYFDIYERDAAAGWNLLVHKELQDDHIVTYMDLDQDGDRVAYLLDHQDLERFKVCLYDVPKDQILFEHEFAAPGTVTQLAGSGVRIDDSGKIVCGISWGDDWSLNPEAYAFDEQGNLLLSIDTKGSGLSIDMTPDGDAFVIGAKATHINKFGPGGDIVVVDVPTKPLRVLGLPEPSGTLQVTACPEIIPKIFWLAIAGGLLEVPNKNNLRLDPSTLLAFYGPFVLDQNGLEIDLTLPNDPLLGGLLIHFQGALFETVPQDPDFTNKVSVRIVN